MDTLVTGLSNSTATTASNSAMELSLVPLHHVDSESDASTKAEEKKTQEANERKAKAEERFQQRFEFVHADVLDWGKSDEAKKYYNSCRLGKHNYISLSNSANKYVNDVFERVATVTVITDAPSNVLRKTSGHGQLQEDDIITPDQMNEFCEVARKLMTDDGTLIVFCAWQQCLQWSDAMSRVHLRVEKNPLSRF
jgi:hypothetical protein